eukprot:13346798-Ditylum_brightwellii.AAC.1
MPSRMVIVTNGQHQHHPGQELQERKGSNYRRQSRGSARFSQTSVLSFGGSDMGDDCPSSIHASNHKSLQNLGQSRNNSSESFARAAAIVAAMDIDDSVDLSGSY